MNPHAKQWILSRQKEVSARLRTAEQLISHQPVTELLNIHNSFHQGQYQEVIDFNTSKLSSENTVPAQVLKWRAQIANGQVKAVLDRLAKEAESSDNAAVKTFALLASGNPTQAQEAAEQLAETSAENTTVQILAGTVLQAVGKSEEALTLLSKHQGNLEAYEQIPFVLL